MIALRNRLVEVELDPQWPRVCRLCRLDTGGELGGADRAQPFALELNGTRREAGALTCTVEAGTDRATYTVAVADLGLELVFSFALEGETLVLRADRVVERAAFRLEKLYIPDHRLVSGAAARGDWLLRHVTRRRNWASAWCPGTGTYDQWEDTGAVGGALPERGALATNYACAWNDRICAALRASIAVQPLVTEVSADGAVKPGRAGRFSMWAGTWSYRLRGRPARPLEVRIGVLGDYDGNGRIDWCDAANWDGDLTYAGREPSYRGQLVYKLMVGIEGRPGPNLAFADCLAVIRDVHAVTGGMPQVCYLVGWQYDGHDTGYPSLAKVNPKCGGREALVKLIEDARALNCTVSLHINYDSCYDIHPEWREDCVSRDGEGRPFVWYAKPHLGGRRVYSMNHTKDVETGFARDRLDRLCAMLPLAHTIHCDAFRPYSESWEPDGSHIDAECEVQRGMLPILDMFRAKGLDMTTEDTDAEKRGLFGWVWIQADWLHGYETVMHHGRVFGRGRAGLRGGKEATAPEGAALGLGYVASERQPRLDETVENIYLYWMPYQLLSRKTMTGYRVGDWKLGVRAWYGDDTEVHAEPYPYTVEVRYEGLPMARGTDRFMPWDGNTIYAFSREGSPQEWKLPAAWAGRSVRAVLVRREGEEPWADFRREGNALRFTPPPRVPVRFTGA